MKALWPHVSMIVTSGYGARRPERLPDTVAYMPKPWLALEVLMQAEKAAARMQRAAATSQTTITSASGEAANSRVDFAGAALQREALVDVALVGDLVGVDRGRVRQQQHARDALGRARMRGVPSRERAAHVLAHRRMAASSGRAVGAPSPISFWQPAALSQHSSAMNSRSAPATIASCRAGEQAASAPTRRPPTCTQVPVVSLKSSARRPSNITPRAGSFASARRTASPGL